LENSNSLRGYCVCKHTGSCRCKNSVLAGFHSVKIAAPLLPFQVHGHVDAVGAPSGSWRAGADFSKKSGISGPLIPSDAIKMTDWAISHGYLYRWTCARILHLTAQKLLDFPHCFRHHNAKPKYGTIVLPRSLLANINLCFHIAVSGSVCA
jgi:hypothetical protein